MKQRQIYPIVFAPSYSVVQITTFRLADKEVEVNAPRALINELMRTCDGEKTLGETLDILSKKWDRATLQRFIGELLHANVVLDGTSLSSQVWPFVKNPPPFARYLTKNKIDSLVRKASLRHRKMKSGIDIGAKLPSSLKQLLESRRSVRIFSESTVGQNSIAYMLWSAYGVLQNKLLVNGDAIERHTVPSAGALYPLHLSISILRKTGNLEVGIYDVSATKEIGVVRFSPVKDDIYSLTRSFVDPTVLKNAQGVIAISGSFDISADKYGNRSLLYVPIEAGHAAQNIHLAAAEEDVGTVEIGGFFEEELREILCLPKSYWPLTTVVFGKAAEETIDSIDRQDMEIRWAPPKVNGYKLPFSMAFVRIPVKSRSTEWSCGRSKDPLMAYTKALSEAEEWSTCGNIGQLLMARMDELENAIDPRLIVKYHPNQYKRKSFPFAPFRLDKKYAWVAGKNLTTGEDIFLLADCIYFPYFPSYPRYTFANSCGVAAYPNMEGAIEHAALELIERDAFMVTWLNWLILPEIYFKSLPSDIQKRIKTLERIGFRIVVKDMTFDLTPVVFILAQNRNMPLTACAGCSSFELMEAVDRALMEIEASIYCSLNNKNRRERPILPRDVRQTLDHGRLYQQSRFFKRADFLFKNRKFKRFPDLGKGAAKTWTQLLDRLIIHKHHLLVTELSNGKNTVAKNLSVVKVFVLGLVPMNFGYGTEALGMERIYNLPAETGYRFGPSSYATVTKFPHPYT